MISVLSQQLEELKKRNEELEKERLANVPMDTGKEIKNLQNKIVSPLFLSIQYVDVGGHSLLAVTHLLKTFIFEAKVALFTIAIVWILSLFSSAVFVFAFFCCVSLFLSAVFVFVFFCCFILICLLLLLHNWVLSSAFFFFSFF